MRNPRQVLTRSLIFERVWGYDFASTSRSLDSYVCYLRRKLEADGELRLIQTVRESATFFVKSREPSGTCDYCRDGPRRCGSRLGLCRHVRDRTRPAKR